MLTLPTATDETVADESAEGTATPAPEPPQTTRRRGRRAGPSPLGTTLARAAGAGTTAVLVGVGPSPGGWVVPIFAVALTWLAVTAGVVLRHGWTARAAGAIAVVDLGAIVAIVLATGDVESTALKILWLAPIGWAIVLERRTAEPLLALVGLAYVGMWLPTVLRGDDDAWRDLATFFSMYLAGVAMAFVALRLRAESDAHTERLAAARTALTRELGQVERDERERLSIRARQDLVDHLEGDPEALEIGISTLDESIFALRSVATDLFPDQDGGSIVREQLRSIAAAWEARGDFDVRLSVDEAVGERSDAMLVGMVAELVGNAAKHASPTFVSVRLRDGDDGVILDVTDDGAGMTADDRLAAEQTGHIGLRSLDRRIRAIGGRWQIRSAPGQGTVVRVVLPR